VLSQVAVWLALLLEALVWMLEFWLHGLALDQSNSQTLITVKNEKK
jgi:type VI protein secretion system component VasF